MWYTHKSSVNLGLPSENLGGLSMIPLYAICFARNQMCRKEAQQTHGCSDHFWSNERKQDQTKENPRGGAQKSPPDKHHRFIAASQPTVHPDVPTPITVPHRTCVHLRPERSQTADIGQALPGPARRSEAKRGTTRMYPQYFDNMFVPEGALFSSGSQGCGTGE